MSWRFSQALVGEFSAATCSAGEPSALSSTTPIALKSSPSGRTTASSGPSPSGTTSAHLTGAHGEALLTWFLAGFPAKPSAAPRLDATTLKTFGRRCGESWQMSLPGASLPRTSRSTPLTARRTTSSRWVTASDAWRYPRKTWVLTTYGAGTGFLHTPTRTANYCAPSMQKHPSCRLFLQVFGFVSPSAHEYLMDWPIGWSRSAPLEMDKYRQWLRSHSQRSLPVSEGIAA